MEHAPWEGAAGSTDQQISHLLWDLKLYYPIHKKPLLGPIPSRINPVHILKFHFSEIAF
jgi:hypothetical protein